MVSAQQQLRFFAESLQDMSRVLSVKGAIEQSIFHESAIQLLGNFILDEVVVREVAAGGALDVSVRAAQSGIGGRDALQVLLRDAGAVLVSDSGEHLVLLHRVQDADDWEALPVQLQNYVAEAQFPCQIVLGVQQMKLEGDSRFRHYAVPVFCVLSADGSSGMSSCYAFVQKEHREQVLKNPAEVEAGAAAMLEPYLRVVAQYAIENREGVANV